MLSNMCLYDGREKVPNYGKLPNGAQLGQYSIGASLWQLVQGAFLCSASHEYNRPDFISYFMAI